MSQVGYIQFLAVTSKAQIPLENVAITVTALDGTAIAMRLTNRNGLTDSVEVPAPELSAGLEPNSGIRPFTAVNVSSRLDGYEQTEYEHLQVFPGITTRLVLQLIPLSELPDHWDKVVIYDTPAQNL